MAAGRSIWGQCLGHLLSMVGLGGAQPGAAVGQSPREQPGAAGGAVLQSWGGGNGPEHAAPAEQGTRRDTSLPGKPARPRWDVCLTRCSLSRQLEPSGCSRLAKSMRGGIQPRSHTPASPGGSGFGSALARSGSASPAHLGEGPRCPVVPPPLPARCGTSVPAGVCAEVGEQLPGAGSLPGESCSFSRSISRGWSDLRMAGQKFGERAVLGGGGVGWLEWGSGWEKLGSGVSAGALKLGLCGLTARLGTQRVLAWPPRRRQRQPCAGLGPVGMATGEAAERFWEGATAELAAPHPCDPTARTSPSPSPLSHGCERCWVPPACPAPARSSAGAHPLCCRREPASFHPSHRGCWCSSSPPSTRRSAMLCSGARGLCLRCPGRCPGRCPACDRDKGTRALLACWTRGLGVVAGGLCWGCPPSPCSSPAVLGATAR